MNIEAATAEELEFLGDDRFDSGQLNDALDFYVQARRLRCDALDLALASQQQQLLSVTAFNADMSRLNGKIQAISTELAAPPQPVAEQIASIRTELDEHLMDGRIDLAAHLSVQLGAALEELDDQNEAESAYRYAVALARQVDARDPELLLHTFWTLIDFLPPSEESLALAQEMATNLIKRKEMYHPMRAAEAAYCWATTELNFAERHPDRIDRAVNTIARQAMEMLDGTCLHDQSQHLQREVAEILRRVGRDIDAAHWQAKADEYEDWEPFTDQQIPGHVHLWDIRGDVGS